MASRIDIKMEESSDHALLVHVRGQLSLDTIYAFEEAIGPLFAKNYREISLDCVNMDYIDSTGLGTLVKYYNLSHDRGITFTLYNLSHGIREILDTANLSQFFITGGNMENAPSKKARNNR